MSVSIVIFSTSYIQEKTRAAFFFIILVNLIGPLDGQGVCSVTSKICCTIDPSVINLERGAQEWADLQLTPMLVEAIWFV